MATVRMSDALLNEISHKAEITARASVVRPAEMELDGKLWADELYNLYMELDSVKAYFNLFANKSNHLGKRAFSEQEVVVSIRLGDVANTRYVSQAMSKSRPWPLMLVNYSGAKIELTDSESNKAITAHMEKWDDYHKARADYQDQINEFARSITLACRQFPTLNQALKNIPHLDKLVPYSYMEKVNKKNPPRKKKEAVELEIDTHSAAAKIAQARLMGKL